jgi:WxL Interacting Protein, peptidoglycan binding domain
MTRWARHAAAIAAGALLTGALSAGPLPALAAPGGHAAAAAAALGNGSFAIAPTPPPGSTQPPGYFSMIALPGQKFAESVSVANFTKAPLKLLLYPADAYTIRKGGGFAVAGIRAVPRDLGTWISKLPKAVTIPARKQLDIRFTLHVPGNATPGTHAGGIVAQSAVPQLVQVNGRLRARVYRQVFTRVYTTVSGRLIPNFEIDNMAVTHPQPPFPLVSKRNGQITYFLSNTGNALISPTVHVWVTGLFGTSLDRSLPATSQLLPGGIASYQVAWPGVPAIGPVHVHLAVRSSYGLTRTAEYSYTAWPVPFLAAVAVLVIAALAATVLLLARRKRAKPAAAPGTP